MRTLLILDDNVELARLLGVVAEVYGFTPKLAHSGKEALAFSENSLPQAALIDLLLPDMSGQSIVSHLASKGVVTVAMSGVFRGKRFSHELLETHGAKAFFEKPLAAREVMLRIAEFLGSLESAPKPPAPSTPPTEEDEFHEIEVLVEDNLHKEEERIACGEKSVIAEMDLPPDLSAYEGAPSSNNSLSMIHPRSPTRRTGSWPSTGKLEFGSFSRLLTAIWLGQNSGEIVFSNSSTVKVIAVQNGHIVYAASNLENERFCWFAKQLGKLDQSTMGDLSASDRDSCVGATMVQRGLITLEERVSLVSTQVREIVCSLLTWQEGNYRFWVRSEGLREDLLPLPLSLAPGPLLLEGFRCRFTLEQLTPAVETNLRYFPTADPPYELHDLNLTNGEARLLAHADGSKTLDDLILLSELPKVEALAAIVAFTQMHILEIRPPSLASSRVVLV
jgi:DNA-binding response OmpR family regulator